MLIRNFNEESSFSYAPVRFVKNQNKKQNKTKNNIRIESDFKDLMNDKVEQHEIELFNSAKLLENKIVKLEKSIEHISEQLKTIDKSNIFYDIALRAKLGLIQAKHLRYSSRCKFLKENTDILHHLEPADWI